MRVTVETFSDIYEEMKFMYQKHHDELNGGLGIKLNINTDLYGTLESIDRLLTLVARVDGKPVGFLVSIVSEMPHHKGEMIINADSFHVLHNARKSGAGKAMFTKLVEIADRMEVKFLMATVKAQNDAGKFMEKLGFELHEKVYMKRLQ